jgi:hypothetical protein
VNAPDTIASRLIGSLFVDRGLVSESQIRVALEIQRETGEQLGQILVQRFGVSRKELARVVAEQWKDMGRGGGSDGSPSDSWRPLGEIFVTRGFISEEELDDALKRQRKTGERLGEALVGLGVISKFELAGALAEQMASLGEMDEESPDGVQGDVVPLPARPVATDDLPYGALTQDPSVAEPDQAQDANVEDAVEAPPEPPLIETATNGDATLEPVEADGMVEDEPAPEQPEAVDVGVSLAAAPETSAPFELEQPIDLWPDSPQDVEPEVEESPEAEADHEPAAVEPVHVGVDPGPQFEFEADVPVPVEPVHVGVDPGPQFELEADVPVPVEPVYVGVDPEPQFELEADVPAPVEPVHVGIDPEPHFELEADVPESIGTWHLLVAEPEPRHGLCVAFAPTRVGYRLVPLSEVPSVGEIVDVAEVGSLLVLRLGASPLPGDTRVCAYVEDAVVPASATA